ncbi:MAG TPA: putative glycoside hydrolase [Candidatus Cloacimonadota bacterium]|nr:putative glycoside hydrolase [Candidatus Cloacimonadota bacterium]
MKKITIYILLLLVGISVFAEQNEIIQQKTFPKIVEEETNNYTDTNRQKDDKTENEFYKSESKFRQPDFVQGIYLTAYKVASKEFDVILAEAAAAGINTVVFDLKNMNGEVFFKTAQNQFLTSENQKPIIDIKSVTKRLHERNMRAVSRVVMFHDIYNAKRDSTLRATNADSTAWMESKKRGPAWLDPSNPQVQNYLFDLINEIAKSGVDEIQMDYVRFPTQGTANEAIFYFQKEDEERVRKDSLYVNRERKQIIKEFVKNVKKICDKHDVTLSADVFAIVAWQRNADIKSTGQDMELLTENLNNIHPMIYSSHFADNFGYRKNVPNEPYLLMYQGTKYTMNSTIENCNVVPYIQANAWKVNYKKDYLEAQIRAIKDVKAKGFILWNASNKYKETLTWLTEMKKPD